jgi:VCBS repeat-containing protein
MNKPAPLLDETAHDTQDEPSREQPPSENEQDTAAPGAAHAGSPASGAAETQQPGETRAVADSTPRIVEGSLVESILLSEAADEAPETEEAAGTALPDAPYPTSQPPPRTRLLHLGLLLAAWIIPIVLLGTLLLAQFVPGLAGPLSHVVPGWLPSATVTLVPISESMQLTSAITAVTGTPEEGHQEIGARLLSVSTPAVAQTVPTTGTGHTAATHATGSVTFYNEAPYAQTVPAGTVLTGADGVQIATETTALILAGNPPSFGVVTVPAHTVLTGPGGNIAAFDLAGLCCAAGVAVKNTTAFTGGQRARDFAAVAQRDVQQVAGPLITTLTQSAQETLTTQVHPTEQVVSPERCTPTVHPDHPVGSEATQVSITVSVTCRGELYDAQGAKVLAATLLAQQAARILGSSYEVVGEVTTQIVGVKVVDAQRGTLLVSVSAEGVWSYPLSQTRLHQLASLIAGTRLQDAKTLLLHTQGIRAVTITLSGGNGSTLPTNPDQITLRLLIVVGL